MGDMDETEKIRHEEEDYMAEVLVFEWDRKQAGDFTKARSSRWSIR